MISGFFEKRWFVYGLVFLLCWLAYSNNLHNGFMIDDRGLLQDAATGQMDLANPSDKHFRPVAYFIFVILYHLFGDNPFGYHLMGILFFYLNCLVMFTLWTRLMQDRKIALAATALFSVHPMNVMMASHITSSVISLYALFMQWGALFFLYFLSSEKKPFYVLSLMAFVIAVFCHEITLILPFYLALFLLYKRYHWREVFLKTSIFWILAVPYILFRMYFASLQQNVLHHVSDLKISFLSYFSTYGEIVFWYLQKMIVPMDITMIYNVPIVFENTVFLTLRWAVLFSVIGYGGIYLLKEAKLRMAFLFFLLGFIPVGLACLTMPFLGLIIQPQWFYFSSMGFFVLIGSVFLTGRGGALRTFRFILLAVTLIFWGFMAREYNVRWKDEKSFSQDWLRIRSESPSANFYLGNAYFVEGDYGRAKKYFAKSFIQTSRDAQTYTSLGLAELNLGNFDTAIDHFKAALKVNPRYAFAYNNMGLAYLRKGDLVSARDAFVEALKTDWRLLEPRLNLAVFSLQEKRPQNALEFCLENLRIDSYDNRTLALLVRIYFELGQKDEAVKAGEVLVKHGHDARSLLGSANLLVKNKEYAIALNLFLKAREKNALAPDVYYELGRFYAFRGQLYSAISVWKEGLRIAPQDARFMDNINKAKKLLGQI